jgi:hypothetical protein
MKGMCLVAPAPAYSNMIEDRHMHLGVFSHLQQSASLGHRSCHRHFGELRFKLYLNLRASRRDKTIRKCFPRYGQEQGPTCSMRGGGAALVQHASFSHYQRSALRRIVVRARCFEARFPSRERAPSQLGTLSSTLGSQCSLRRWASTRPAMSSSTVSTITRLCCKQLQLCFPAFLHAGHSSRASRFVLTHALVLSSSAVLCFAMCSECLKADCGCLCSRLEKVVSSFGLRV